MSYGGRWSLRTGPGLARTVARMLAVPLRGRSDEADALAALVATLRAAPPRDWSSKGQPVSARADCWRELEGAATAEGVLVAAGRADEIEDIAPLSPLLAALSAGDPPVLHSSELLALERPGDQRYWLLEELGELLELRSRDVPILVILDDMQWADSVTTWAVRLLSQRLASSPIGWVLAARTQTAPPPVAALLSTLVANGAPRLELQPLDANDMAGIAADVLGAAADPELTDFLGGVGGNPFLGLDLLQALVADDAITIDDGVASLVERRVPDRFRASVRGRLATLSHNALHLVQAGSVFGRSFRIADVAAMLASLAERAGPGRRRSRARERARRGRYEPGVLPRPDPPGDLARHEREHARRAAPGRGRGDSRALGLGDRSRDAPARVGGTRRRSGDRGTARRRGRDLRPGSSHRGRAHPARASASWRPVDPDTSSPSSARCA